MKTSNIKDIMIPLDVVLGSTYQSVEQLAEICEGSVITLNSLAGDPVNLVAAGEIIAKGEVVIIDENFGIRVTHVVSEEE